MAGRLSVFGRLGQTYLRFHYEQAARPSLQQFRNLQTCNALFAVTKLTMPALSPTMEEGTIIKWHKKEGDVINPGDSVCEIQTDKAVLTLDIEEEGILAKILLPDDAKNVRVGSLIALMVEEGEDWENVEVPTAKAFSSAPRPTTSATCSTGSTEPMPLAKPAIKLGYGPAVRSILDIYKISADDVQGTGPHSRLLKGDLLRHIKDKSLKLAPVGQVAPPVGSKPDVTSQERISVVPVAGPLKSATPPAAFESEGYIDHDVTGMRKVIAKRLTESKTTIPHAYATADCHIDNVLAMRKELMADGIKVSVNDFIVKAAAVALQRVPAVNANVAEDGVHLLDSVDISVAVATQNGLITPIIKNAIGLGVQDISINMKDLASRAREGKLKLNEFQGGSFTISNLGMFGISEFSAVINPPQACIMAVGTSRLVPSDADDSRPETWMSVTLSSDARVVDDLLAAQFLAAFREALENPMLMVGSGSPKDLHVNDGGEMMEEI